MSLLSFDLFTNTLHTSHMYTTHTHKYTHHTLSLSPSLPPSLSLSHTHTNTHTSQMRQVMGTNPSLSFCLTIIIHILANHLPAQTRKKNVNNQDQHQQFQNSSTESKRNHQFCAGWWYMDVMFDSVLVPPRVGSINALFS